MDNDDTGNGQKLPLAERARRGYALELHEVMALEFPTAKSYKDQQQPRYKGWQSAIEAAIEFGLLVSRKEPRREVVVITGLGRRTSPVDHYGTIIHHWIDRASYQTWRTSQPEPPTGSFISLWLGATPAVETLQPAEPSLPVAISVKLRPDQQDKLDCQKIARELWAEHPEWRQTDLLKHPRVKSYLTQWEPKTVSGWLSEVDPRPKEQRRGRPKKPC